MFGNKKTRTSGPADRKKTNNTVEKKIVDSRKKPLILSLTIFIHSEVLLQPLGMIFSQLYLFQVLTACLQLTSPDFKRDSACLAWLNAQ